MNTPANEKIHFRGNSGGTSFKHPTWYGKGSRCKCGYLSSDCKRVTPRLRKVFSVFVSAGASALNTALALSTLPLYQLGCLFNQRGTWMQVEGEEGGE